MAEDYSQYIPEKITQAGQSAAELSKIASSIGAGAYSFPAKLKEALQKKLNYHQDIIQQQAQAQASYFAAPSAARAKYTKQPGEAGYINPMQAEALTAGERAGAYAPYASLTGILGQRMGTVQELVGQGTGAYQAQVSAAQGAAQLAQQQYQQQLGEYQLGAGMEQQAWQRQQQEAATALAQQQYEQQQAWQQQQWEAQQAQYAQQYGLQQQQWAAQQAQYAQEYGLTQQQWAAQQAQTAWEQPWQEKLWQYQLNQPYYKETGGGGAPAPTPAPFDIGSLWEQYQAELKAAQDQMVKESYARQAAAKRKQLGY